MEEKKPLRIALCLHAYNFIDFDVYFNHLWCIAHWRSPNYELVFCGKKGLDNATARNELMKVANEKKCTHMLFLDADHLVPVEMLDCLLQLSDEAIVSGLVCKRGEGFPQVAFNKVGDSYVAVELPLDGKQYQVYACAFGCTLVSMHHLNKLKEPVFRDNCVELPGRGLCNLRSDILLCDSFNKIGEKCWIDTRVLVGHHGINRVVYPQNAKTLRGVVDLERSDEALKKGQEGFFYDIP